MRSRQTKADAVSGVLLGREPEDGSLFSRSSVEHSFDHLLRGVGLLVLVHLDDLVSVFGTLIEAIR